MDRLEAITLFVAAVEEGSLAAAARRHGRSPASVTRAVALLEVSAGETLLLRSTRRLSPTPAGERHLLVWRDVLARLHTLEGGEQADTSRGRIVLTAPELFGRLKVMPVLDAFLARQPLIEARVLLVNRIVDLMGEGIDLAVRIAALPDSGLTAVRIGDVRLLVCAAPDYLDRAGCPTDPGDLVRHACVGLNVDGGGELWPFAFAGAGTRRARRSVRVPARLSVNHAGAAIDAAVRGGGLVRARSYQVEDHIGAGRLVPVLAGFEPAAEPVHLVFHPDRAKRGAVRAFVDHAVPALRTELRRVEAVIDVAAPPATSSLASG